MLTTGSVVGDLTHLDEEGGLEPSAIMSDLLHDDGPHDSDGFDDMGPSDHEKEPTGAPAPNEVVKQEVVIKRKPGRPPGRKNATKPKGTAVVTQRRSGRVVDQEKGKEPPGGPRKRVSCV